MPFERRTVPSVISPKPVSAAESSASVNFFGVSRPQLWNTSSAWWWWWPWSWQPQVQCSSCSWWWCSWSWWWLWSCSWWCSCSWSWWCSWWCSCSWWCAASISLSSSAASEWLADMVSSSCAPVSSSHGVVTMRAFALWPRSSETHSSSFSAFIVWVRLRITAPACSIWLLKNSPKFFIYIFVLAASATVTNASSSTGWCSATPCTAWITSESLPTPDGSIKMRSGW